MTFPWTLPGFLYECRLWANYLEKDPDANCQRRRRRELKRKEKKKKNWKRNNQFPHAACLPVIRLLSGCYLGCYLTVIWAVFCCYCSYYYLLAFQFSFFLFLLLSSSSSFEQTIPVDKVGCMQEIRQHRQALKSFVVSNLFPLSLGFQHLTSPHFLSSSSP